MQAHPQSSLAARINSTAHPASTPTPPQPQPQTRVLLTSNSAPLSASPTPTLADTAGLAHDAGNLLAALGLYCDLLSIPGVLRPEHRHYATELSLISDRSSELIRRLLAVPLAAIQFPPQPGVSMPRSLQPTDVRRCDARSSDATTTSPNHAYMLRSLAPVLQRIAAGAANVSVTCPALLPPLDFPSGIIERITVNLVRNAAEAIRSQNGSTDAADLPHRGEIRISLAVVASWLQLTVEDNGPGMPPAIAAAFLQPSPLPRGASRGLGHRIIHELATTSGGQISIRVLRGSGTIFCLKWPIPSALLLEPAAVATPQPRL
jgi:signal transduction histidine kinase